MEQPIVFAWQIKSWFDVIGLVAAVLFVVVGVVLVASILSKNGFRLGRFRAGVRRGEERKESCVGGIREHEAVLKQLSESNVLILRSIDGIVTMQKAQNKAFDVLLGQLEGEVVNGNLRDIRRELARAEGFQEASIAEDLTRQKVDA